MRVDLSVKAWHKFISGSSRFSKGWPAGSAVGFGKRLGSNNGRTAAYRAFFLIEALQATGNPPWMREWQPAAQLLALAAAQSGSVDPAASCFPPPA
jgi:hypothetical protein